MDCFEQLSISIAIQLSQVILSGLQLYNFVVSKQKWLDLVSYVRQYRAFGSQIMYKLMINFIQWSELQFCFCSLGPMYSTFFSPQIPFPRIE